MSLTSLEGMKTVGNRLTGVEGEQDVRRDEARCRPERALREGGSHPQAAQTAKRKRD